MAKANCYTAIKYNDGKEHTLNFSKFMDTIEFVNGGGDMTFDYDPREKVTELSICKAQMTDEVNLRDLAGCNNLQKISVKNIKKFPIDPSQFPQMSSIELNDTYDLTASQFQAYTGNLNVRYSKFSMDKLDINTPVWSDPTFDNIAKISVLGFDESSEERKLPFGFFGFTPSLKHVTVDENATIDSTGCSQQGGLALFAESIKLEKVTFAQTLTPSALIDQESQTSAYYGRWFSNKYEYDPELSVQVLVDTYLSSMIVEFKKNTIEEILEIENLPDDTPVEYGGPFVIGSLIEVPQIKCGDMYYNLSADSTTMRIVIGNKSSEPMKLVYSPEAYCWISAS